MAIVHMDSFDHYGGSEADLIKGIYLAAGNCTLDTAKARTGAYSLFMTNGAQLRVVVPDRPDTAGAGMSIWFDSLPGVSDRAAPIRFQDRDGNVQVYVGVDTTGALRAWAGDNFTTPLGTSSPVLTTGAWQHLEARCKVHASAGEVEVRVNGVTVIAVSGVDTRNSSSSYNEIAQIGVLSGAGITQTPYWFDDFYVWDTSGANNNDFIGDRRVLTHVADQDTTIQDWTLSSGSNGYQLIDDIPPDDATTYIEADFTAVGDQSAFEFQDLGAEVSAVTAVQVIVRSIKTDAGAANVQASMISEYNEALGADNSITTTWTDRKDIFETNPDTGAPWTRDQVNAALIAVRRTL